MKTPDLVLDHSGIFTDVSGQPWPYESRITRRSCNAPQTDRDALRCDLPRFEGQGYAIRWLNRLSMTDSTRCVAKEIRQDSQPLRTSRLRSTYVRLKEYETQPFYRRVWLRSIAIWLIWGPYIRLRFWSKSRPAQMVSSPTVPNPVRQATHEELLLLFILLRCLQPFRFHLSLCRSGAPNRS
jgi:hypothetical protein